MEEAEGQLDQDQETRLKMWLLSHAALLAVLLVVAIALIFIFIWFWVSAKPVVDEAIFLKELKLGVRSGQACQWTLTSP